MPSSKLRKSASTGEEDCAMDMSPMIDMVFLLLIFFIVNATAIVVKTDPDVDPPVAKNAKPQSEKEGRIVVNIHEDGIFTNENFEPMDNKEAVGAYVEEKRKEWENRAIEPRLHLRGHKRAVFKYGKQAILAAAEKGVNQVIFATYTREPNPE